MSENSLSRNTAATTVILGLGLSGLEAARALGRRRIPVIGLDTQLGLAASSRYCKALLCGNPRHSPAELVRELLALREKLSQRPVLVPLGDDWVMFLAKHQEALSSAYAFVQSKPSLVMELTDKSTCYRLATEHGLTAPRYFAVENEADLLQAAEEVGFPCLMKPALSADWAQPQARAAMGPRKIFQANNLTELKSAFAAAHPHSGRLVLQELIPGLDTDHNYVTCYMKKNGNAEAYLVHRKILMHPPGRGVGCLIESIHSDVIAKQTIVFLKAIGYVGIAGLEFKIDQRDGRYKLLDFNPRFGQGDTLCAICGLDMLWLYYCEALGLPSPSLPASYREGVKWIHLRSYLSAVWQARRSNTRSLWRSLTDLRGPLHHAVFAPDDLKPALWLGRDFIASRLKQKSRVHEKGTIASERGEQ